jgi:tRNA (guanine37-N1)-methyltransferase
VLLSGNHRLMADWRHDESVRRTAERRPDLLAAWGDVLAAKDDSDAVRILPATAADAGEIHVLQLAGFLSEARLYDDYTLPPLTEDVADTADRLEHSVALKAVAGARIVGSVQLAVDGSVGQIERLVVAPDWQGRGLGARLLRAAEQLAPSDVTSYTLNTGARSDRNLALYRKAGYRETGREAQTPKVDLVYLTKRRRRK